MSNALYFACKTISFDELIKCSFNLNKTDYNLLTFLIKNDERMTVVEIAEKMGLERSTVQKSIKNLVSSELVKRLQINKEGGGYIFYYQIKDKQYIKHQMMTLMDSWVQKAKDQISRW